MKCGQWSTLKSNLAVIEELQRIQEQALPLDKVGCQNSTCSNFGQLESSPPIRYQSFGQTNAGSLRYRCKACKKTFTVSQKSSLRLRMPEKTSVVFKLLINKSPMRRICEIAELNPAVLYQRIGLIYDQCIRFAAVEEAKLKKLTVSRLGIAVDRQEHVINWSSQFDRRVTQLGAIASADAASGYIFGMHLDYDHRYDVHDLELAARECGDPEKLAAFRRYARIFLSFEGSEDHSDDPFYSQEARLPSRGVRIHAPYTLYAHFLYLKEKLPAVSNLHFYLDREASIRGGCFTAFAEELRGGRAEAFLVKIDKSMSVDAKKRTLAASNVLLQKAAAKYPGMRRIDVAKKLLAEGVLSADYTAAPIHDRWIKHPMPNMGEPSKAMCYISDRGDLSADTLADALFSARMHALDRFFMQVRRRLSVLERPIQSASSNRRWHGYAVYNPVVVMKLLEIFRVAYNFVLVGEDHKTPAMRIGLASKAATLDEIVDFMPG